MVDTPKRGDGLMTVSAEGLDSLRVFSLEVVL